MRHRLFSCFLLATALLVFSIERLPFQGGSLERIFAMSWLVFAVVVIGGNLQELLHKRRRGFDSSVIVEAKRMKARDYGR